MEDPFRFADDLGPARIVHVYEPSVGLRGTLVVDNVAIGPSIGGLRMAPDVSTEECFRLARAMTLKNAAAGLPHGGGKSVLYGDPKMPLADKERLVRAMACALGDMQDYIFGPDMGTDETCMAWVKDETGRAAGLPRELGGIPLDELGATGFGLCHAAEVAAPFADLELPGARVAVQGMGAVGLHAAGRRAASARPALRKALSDEAVPVRVEAAAAMAALGETTRALEVLERVLRDDRAEAVLHAMRTLELMGDAARPAAKHIEKALSRARDLEAKGTNPCWMFVRFSAEAALEGLADDSK